MENVNKQLKSVRFSIDNSDNIIEKRSRLSSNAGTSNLDDEVKDHPIFTKVPEVTILKKSIIEQIEKNPHCTSIMNPVTNQRLTRFGTRYWELLKTIHVDGLRKQKDSCRSGSTEDLLQSEKEEYRKRFKKK